MYRHLQLLQLWECKACPLQKMDIVTLSDVFGLLQSFCPNSEYFLVLQNMMYIHLGNKQSTTTQLQNFCNHESQHSLQFTRKRGFLVKAENSNCRCVLIQTMQKTIFKPSKFSQATVLKVLSPRHYQFPYNGLLIGLTIPGTDSFLFICYFLFTQKLNETVVLYMDNCETNIAHVRMCCQTYLYCTLYGSHLDQNTNAISPQQLELHLLGL